MSPGSSRIDLLGPPRLTRAGQQVTVRGRKTWALLAVLVGTRSPMERRRLAAMLFDQAEDPLGSLRWHLSQVRRALGVDGVIEGDPVTLRLAPWVVVDLHVLEHGNWRDAVALPGIGAELLAAHFGDAPVFDAWLGAERARVCSLTAGHFTEAAMTLLTADDPAGAARIAARLIELQPLDENHHHLLVRSLVMAGRPAAARRHVRAATVLLTRELGVPPSPNLAACAEAVESGGVASPSAAGVRAQLDAGHAAIDAGATAAGLDCLRRAAREAQVLTDPELAVRALTGLGAALVHAVRGRDTEGAVSLHEAIRVAHDAGRAQSAAAAHRELGWISVQHGRGRQAMAWLDRAHELAGPDVGEQARVLGVRGLALDDGGRHQAAMAAFARSAELARDSGQPRQRAWSLSMWARTYLEFGDHAAAAPLVAEAVTITRREAWNAFLPYPETQHGLLALERGDRNEAADLLQHAYALACHLADPCWEALAQHGLALVELGDGDVRAAVVRLHDARQRCRRHPDTYRWVTAHILDALCGIGVAHRLPDAATWVGELEALALGAGLRDQIVRAHRHRAGLGEPAAAASAELLARETDNPALLS